MVSVNPYRQSRDDLNSSGSSSDTHSLPIPPHQIPAEQAVLGAIMMDNEQFEKVRACYPPKISITKITD